MKKSFRQLFFITLASIALTFIFQLVAFEKIDCFFIDLSQIVFREENPGSAILATVRLPEFASIRDLKPLDYNDFKKINDSLASGNPNKIVYYLLNNDISENPEEQHKILKFIENDKKIYIHSSIQFPDKSLDVNPIFKNYPRFFSPTYTHDTEKGGLDGKSRRVYIAWNANKPDEFIELLKKDFHLPIKADSFAGTLSIYESKQAWMKLWKDSDFGNFQIDQQFNISPSDKKNLNNKIVLVGRLDSQDLQSSPSVFAFWGDGYKLTDQQKFTHDSALTANIITNLVYPWVHLKKAPPWISEIWMFLIGVFFLWSAANLRPAIAIGLLTTMIPISIALPFLLIGISHWVLAFFHILLMAVAIHYITIPILLGRFFSIQEKKSLEIKTKIEEERLTNRIVARSAQADFATSLARQVAHDIRGPLTAVSLIGSLPLESFTQDHKKLLSDASQRLQRVAQDVLSRSGKDSIDKQKNPINIFVLISELTLAYKKTFPHLQISLINEVSMDIFIEIEESILERALTNLLTNAAEALQVIPSTDRVVTIEVREDNDKFSIGVSDTGPGVPKEIETKILKEQVTYGKAEGHGLGLFGTNAALAQVGCHLRYERNNNKTTFWIDIPKDRQKILLPVKNTAIVVDPDREIFQYLKKQLPANIKLLFFNTAAEAMPIVQKFNQASETFTLITEVAFSQSPLTGFDLLQEIQHSPNMNKFIFTLLADNKEIQVLAAKMGAQVFPKSSLFKAEFKIL